MCLVSISQNSYGPTIRSSHPWVFCKKGVLRNLAKFAGKHLCQNLLFNKVVGLAKFTGKHPCQSFFLIKLQICRPTTLLKKRLWHRCFPANFAKFLRTPFLTEHFGGCFYTVKSTLQRTVSNEFTKTLINLTFMIGSCIEFIYSCLWVDELTFYDKILY